MNELPNIVTWNGRDIETMSRGELLDVIRECAAMLMEIQDGQQARWEASAREMKRCH